MGQLVVDVTAIRRANNDIEVCVYAEHADHANSKWCRVVENEYEFRQKIVALIDAEIRGFLWLDLALDTA